MKEELGINEWLELIKEDKNLNGAYISISQYIYLIEKENQKLNKQNNNFKTSLDESQEIILDYIKENQKLKKQVEELNRFKFSYKKDETQIPATIYNKKTIEDISKIKSQQKEFIKYLEEKEKQFDGADPRLSGACSGILQKYKEIIGDDK